MRLPGGFYRREGSEGWCEYAAFGPDHEPRKGEDAAALALTQGDFKVADEEQKQSRIPEFKSLEEAAEFWDTHSFEEFANELEEVSLEPTPEFRRRVEERRR